MKSRTVYWEGPRKLIQPSPGFAKKELSDYHLDLMAKCEFECTYCSSNMGNQLRVNRPRIITTTQNQLGVVMIPGRDRGFNIQYRDVLENLDRQLYNKDKSYGDGQTIVFSMLTDGFSPSLVQQRITQKALETLLERTSFRIRVLTKYAGVGNSKWIDFFGQYPDRFVVGLSIGTLDNDWAREVEIGTSPSTKRAEATRALQDAGVPTYGMLCPVLPTQYARLPLLQELVDAIRPEYCETVWAEPYNDRLNWKHVRDGFEQGSDDWRTINEMFSPDGKLPRNRRKLWSNYATDLLLDLRNIAREEGWSDKLKFLLYERDIKEEDAARIGNLEGVLLQQTNKQGESVNPHFVEMQKLAA